MNLNSTDSREIRRFGLIAFILFGSLCALGLWSKKLAPSYIFGLLSILGCGFILVPFHLKPVYTSWLKLAYLFGTIVTILILTLAYYLVITPSALIKRIFGGRPLPVMPDREASSYWVDRAEPVQPKERFIKRY